MARVSKEQIKRVNERLAQDSLTWQDIVGFTLDDHLQDLINNMIESVAISDMTPEEVSEMADVIHFQFGRKITC